MSNANSPMPESQFGGRREKRSEWVQPPTGQLPDLTLRFTAAADLAVSALRNVSNSGASMLVSKPLKPGTSASVVLALHKATMAFVARVIWCRRAEGGDLPLMGTSDDGNTTELYAVGLHLLGPGSFASMVDFAAHAPQPLGPGSA